MSKMGEEVAKSALSEHSPVEAADAAVPVPPIAAVRSLLANATAYAVFDPRCWSDDCNGFNRVLGTEKKSGPFNELESREIKKAIDAASNEEDQQFKWEEIAQSLPLRSIRSVYIHGMRITNKIPRHSSYYNNTRIRSLGLGTSRTTTKRHKLQPQQQQQPYGSVSITAFPCKQYAFSNNVDPPHDRFLARKCEDLERENAILEVTHKGALQRLGSLSIDYENLKEQLAKLKHATDFQVSDLQRRLQVTRSEKKEMQKLLDKKEKQLNEYRIRDAADGARHAPSPEQAKQASLGQPHPQQQPYGSVSVSHHGGLQYNNNSNRHVSKSGLGFISPHTKHNKRPRTTNNSTPSSAGNNATTSSLEPYLQRWPFSACLVRNEYDANFLAQCAALCDKRHDP